jgi:peptidoglycan/LPS O-acetylase OafA/YrhL
VETNPARQKLKKCPPATIKARVVPADENPVPAKMFNPQLEAIRGLATLMVAGGHALVVFAPAGGERTTTDALLFLLNGDAAVTLFFVLSGVVLGMGIQRAGQGTWNEFRAYATRRFFRIYPMFLLATLAVLAFLSVGGLFSSDTRGWFNSGSSYRASVLDLNTPPPAAVVTTNLLMLNPSLNLVTWTLGVEMLCSLLLPLAHYARVRLPAAGTWLLLALAVFGIFIPKWLLLMGWVRLEGALPWQYLGFFHLFYLGYLLPVFGPQVFAWCVRRSWLRRGLLILALAGFLGATRLGDEHRFLAGACAWVILGVVMFGASERSRWFLELPVVRFYGRISYSFYLLHDLVLIVMARLVAKFLFDAGAPGSPLAANLALMAGSIAAVTALAWWTHRTVEMPCIALGKTVAERWKSQRPSGLATSAVSTPNA